jgi:nucleoside-diphosphate-sugar epimerase
MDPYAPPLRLFLVGGTGFIGRQLTRLLLAQGHGVAVYHRGTTGPPPPGARAFHGSRRDQLTLKSAIGTFAPSILVDTNAYTRADTTALLGALTDPVDCLVILSSADVYASYAAFLGLVPPPISPFPAATEESPLRSTLYPYRAYATGLDDFRYDYEKIDVETLARAHAPVPVTILRLPMVYGPGDPQRRVAHYAELLAADPALLRVNPDEGAWRTTRGYVEDVAAAIGLATTDPRAAGGTFNLGEPDALTEIEWIRAIGAASGWRGQVVADPATPPSLPACWRVDLVADSSRLRDRLGFREPVARTEGLRRTLAGAAP